MTLRIRLDRDPHGRWHADVPEIPSVRAEGATERHALAAAEAQALRALADRLEREEEGARAPLAVSFAAEVAGLPFAEILEGHRQALAGEVISADELLRGLRA